MRGSLVTMFWVTDVCDVPMYLFRSVCQDIVIPIALDARLPLDTLFMVFEEDYRFFPDGADIDGCDDYRVRMERMLLQRKNAASHVQELQKEHAANVYNQQAGLISVALFFDGNETC